MRPAVPWGTTSDPAEPRILASAKLVPVVAAGAATGAVVGEAAIAAALTELTVSLLRDPAVRAKLLEAADTNLDAVKTGIAVGKRIASGSIKVAPKLLEALRSFTKRGACSCGDKHDGAHRIAGVMRSAKSTLASGVWRADAAAMWKLLTGSFYAGGDLPVLCVREALQNSLDGLSERWRAAPRSFTPYFVVTLDGSTMTIEDNGIGMADSDFRPTSGRPLSPRLDKFLTLGGSDKAGESFGGFGAAKAVILGAGEAGWQVETGWVVIRSPSAVPGQVYDVAQASSYRQGVKITLTGVRQEYRATPYTGGSSASVEERIRSMLSLNKIPGIALRCVTPNDADPTVTYLYEGRRSASVPDWADLPWSRDEERPAATGTIRMFNRDSGSARLILRLRRMTEWGEAFLLQHAEMLYVSLPRDIFLDLAIRVKPDAPGYPLRVSRDGFVDPTALASWNRIKSDINSEERRRAALAKAEKEKEDWEILYPDTTDLEEQRGGAAVDAAIAEALEGAQEQLDAVLAEMRAYSEDIAQFSMGVEEASGVAGGVLAPEPGLDAAAPDLSGAEAATVFEDVRVLVQQTNEPGDVARGVQALATAAGVVLPADVQVTLSAMAAGDQPSAVETATVLDAVSRVDGALRAGSGGVLSLAMEAPAVAAVAQALVRVSADPEAPIVKKSAAEINPFGNRAFIKISSKMPKDVVRKFKKNIGKYVPLLALWSATLRLVAHAAREIPSYLPGFLLEADTRGEAILAKDREGRIRGFVCLNPIAWDSYVALYPKRADLLAQYLINLACHEVAHLPYLKTMGDHDGHDEDWARTREDLGFRTAPMLSLVERMTAKLLRIGNGGKGPKGPKPDKQELQRLRTALDKATADVTRLDQEVIYYRDWFGNADAAVHDLLRRLDQYDRLATFASWLEHLPPERRPAGVRGDIWQSIVEKIGRNPDLGLRLISASMGT